MSANIECRVDEGFGRWIAGLDGTLLVTTYQAGKIVVVGHDGHQVTVLVRDLDLPMGLAVEGARASRSRFATGVLILADAPKLATDHAGIPGRQATEHLYLPRVSYATGDVRAHDLGFGADGLWIVNTRFSCLCLASAEHSFVPRWMPKFVSACVPEDRCHLSGLAMDRGAPAFVTAHAETDAESGWRDRKVLGGVVIEVASGEPIARGLTMPHSPRIAGDKLWVLDSGEGELVQVDRVSGAHTTAARLEGFARGLCFADAHAVVGLSKIRETQIFGGLPVAARGALRAGLAVVDARSGRVEGALHFTSGCEEIFDVALLPGKRRVHVLDPSKRAGRLALSAPEVRLLGRGRRRTGRRLGPAPLTLSPAIARSHAIARSVTNEAQAPDRSADRAASQSQPPGRGR